MEVRSAVAMKGGIRQGVILGFLTALGLLALVAALGVRPADAQTAVDSWQQNGGDIDGEARFDQSGFSVAISGDGNRVAIGAPANDGNGSSSGHVRVYDRGATGWEQVGADIDGEALGDGSGSAVALSHDGSRVAIGAPGANGVGLNFGNQDAAGQVRIFELSGSSWVQVGADIGGEATFDRSGTSVALSSDGNRVAIGAPINFGAGTNSGHVRVYDWTGTEWEQVGADINGVFGTRSGTSVALSSDGNRVAIGAPFGSAGRVRIHDWNGTSWTLNANINGENSGDLSGTAVALSDDGNTVAIGAPENGDGAGGARSGHVRVFTRSGTSWTQVGADIDGEATFDESGNAVALSADGNRVAIGASLNDGIGSGAGHVRVYDLAGTTWVQVADDIDGEHFNASSGRSVALTDDGTRVAIGSNGNFGGFGSSTGSVRVYDGPPPPPTCNDLAITVDIAAGDVPTAGDDVILGTPAGEVINGLGGNDTICGLEGDDTINAGPGNDWVDAGDGDDTVFGLDGDDHIDGGDGNDELLGFANDDLILGGPGNDTINGGPGNDRIVGGLDDDLIFGQGGDDALFGSDGNDRINGADGNDDLDGSSGDDLINGGPGDDRVFAGDGDDIAFGLAGADVLRGDGGDDRLFGQLGNDQIDGGGDDDFLLGNEGNDTIDGAFGNNTINGGEGNDTLNGGAGNDEIFGDGNLAHAGDDTINGGRGIDLLIGFAGDDTITANDGEADIVNGGPGIDPCTTDAIDTVFNCE